MSKYTITYFFYSLLILVPLIVSSAARAADCALGGTELEVESREATADSWPNLRNSPGSLKFESNRLLTGAAKQVSSAVPASIRCPVGCKPAERATIKYQTIPAKFRSDNSDAERCRTLLEQTTKAPLRYKDRKFSTIDELATWFGDFSNGLGADGKDLYARCDGACSPQYHTTIRPILDGYVLDADVVCGAARDKGDNKYKLTLALHWSCVPGDSPGGN